MAQVVIFEDERHTKLLPLVYTRPVFELRCGISLLYEKVQRMYKGENIMLYTRDYMADVAEERSGLKTNVAPDGPALYINGGAILKKKIEVEDDDNPNVVGVKNGRVVWARLSRPLSSDTFLKEGLVESLKDINTMFPDVAKNPKFVEVTDDDAVLLTYQWDLVKNNPSQIKADAADLVELGKHEGKVYDGVFMVNPENIYIAPGAVVKPGVVLDAEEGPIVIDEGAKIFPQATIEGPAYIGKKSAIKIGAKIYEGTTIGEVCKVGGEVEESIIHSYSNKQHDGFLGHAYLGMWCNLGADTNNSDLKNNYGPVKVFVDGELINSGSMFVGLTMGDHSKSGINSMFNTGTVVGVGCNVFGAGLPPKYIPSFSWGGADGLEIYDPVRCIKVAKTVMNRRKLEMSAAEERMLNKVFNLTKMERTSFQLYPLRRESVGG